MALPMASSAKALAKELRGLREEPVEGFKIGLVDESNLYDWQVAIFGPPGTLYEGGYFKAHIRFPGDYPYSPPSFRFLCHLWHPNVYENGEVSRTTSFSELSYTIYLNKNFPWFVFKLLMFHSITGISYTFCSR